jgi:putative oxidoreductase
MILSSLGKYKDLALLLLRVGMGAMFILHGWPLIRGGPEMWKGLGAAMAYLGITAVPVVWGFIAAVSEFAGGICLVLGLAFRPACLMMACTMTVAAVSHLAGGESVAKASHAIEDSVVFLALLFLGPGRYSIDKK